MRILVTGSGGFVGQHLCRYLRSAGDDVLACPGPAGPGALDVTDGEAVLQRIHEAKPDGIIHLAGISSVGWSHQAPARTFLVNTIGAVNILQGIRETFPTIRLLLISSGEVYGRVSISRRALEEDSPEPLSPYAASKYAAEMVARQYAASYRIQVVCARPFNHLGRGQAAQFVVPSFAQQIAAIKNGKVSPEIYVGDLSAVRDFLHVDDVIRAYRLLLEIGEPGKAYNVCSGEPVSIRGLLEELLALAGLQLRVTTDHARLRPVEIPWSVGDSSRLRAIGWLPKRTVREALAEAFDEALGA